MPLLLFIVTHGIVPQHKNTSPNMNSSESTTMSLQLTSIPYNSDPEANTSFDSSSLANRPMHTLFTRTMYGAPLKLRFANQPYPTAPTEHASTKDKSLKKLHTPTPWRTILLMAIEQDTLNEARKTTAPNAPPSALLHQISS
uniref:Uncharacterized protein n=1 Tax=Cannabis sativa TaxID=3483 RepID=A0A803PVU7_CANSA